MKIYFLSSIPCALHVGGVYFGLTDTFERHAELSLSDKLYVQFSPENALPVGFFLTENIRLEPPTGCEVYLLKDGVAIYASDFPPVDYALRPVAQKREGNLLATVFIQGKPQLSIESPDGFFVATLPPFFSPCELIFHQNLLFLKGEYHLAVYTLRAQPLLCEKVAGYELSEGELTATLPLSDSLQRTAFCRWQLSKTGCELTEFTLRQAENATGEPPHDLLAYAFFESALLKADIAPFLHEELRPDAEGILAFLGDFTAVTLTEKENVCGLVRKKKERLFAVEYYSVQIEEGKITDVRG